MKLRALNPIHWLRSLTTGTALPLLSKELTEQAARKRTYVLRTLYALLLFSMSAMFLASILDRMQRYGFGPWSILGRGQEMLATLLGLQFVGVYLFLPAMVSNVISNEKERNSLTLLMLTDLRPWEIVFQKLVSRLIPMLTFVMLSLPLMALAYAFGGIEVGDVIAAVFIVVLACLQVSACAIMASAYARSTAGAFLLTYFLLAALYFTMPIIGEMVERRPKEEVVWCLTPPFIFAEYVIQGVESFGALLLNCVPIMLSALLFLVLARAFLVSRAMVPPRNLWLGVFRWLDRKFHRMNKLVGGVTLMGDGQTLPDEKPVAWRELTKKALAKPVYLVRILLLIEIPLLLVVVAMVANQYDWRSGDADALSAALFVLWPIVAVLVGVQAANLFVVERGRQTLDVLLTTPISTKEIIDQKMASLRRLWMLLAIPFLTIFFVEAWWEYRGDLGGWNYAQTPLFGDRHDLGPFGFLLYGIFSIIIYIPMVSWFCALIGMRTKSQSRAILASVGGLIGWCLLPMIIIAMFTSMTRMDIDEGLGIVMALTSPMTIVPFAEFDDVHQLGMYPLAMVLLNFFWYGSLTLLFRSMCYANADRWLGRVPERVPERASDQVAKRVGTDEVAAVGASTGGVDPMDERPPLD